MAKAPVSRETTNGTKLHPIAGGGNGSEPLTRTVVMLDVESIDVGANVRVDVAGVDELAASVAEHGVLQPIKVRAAADRWVVVWGQRRLLAARKAGLERIPALTTVDEISGAQLSTEQLVENLHRADLNPMDRARAMRDVVDAGTSQADLARMLGLAPSTVANDIGLLAAPPKVQAAIEQGQLSPAHARAIKGLDGKAQLELAKEAIERGYSAHRTEEEVQQRKRRADAEAASRAKQAKENVAQREQLTASIAEFEKKKVGKSDPIVVSTDHGGSATAGQLVSLIKAAGYENTRVAKGWNEIQPRPAGGVCDCTTWKAANQFTYGRYDPKAGDYMGNTYRVSITKGCVVRKHQEVKEAAAEAKRRAKVALEEKVQAHVRRTASGWAIPEARAIAVERILAEAALFSLLSYNAATWAAARGGTRSNPWPTIHGLTDADLAAELAKAIAGDFRDHAGYHVDWPALAGELGLTDDQPGTPA